MLPFITVVIPVYNEEKYIADTLGQIASQNYPRKRYEVLIIDGMSTDGTLQIAESVSCMFSNFEILKNGKRLSSSARNIGFKRARGEFIIVIDGHVYIENKNLFRDMVDIFSETGLDVLSRPQPLTPPGNGFFQNAVAYARESFIGHGANSTIYTSNYAGPVDPSSSGAMYRKSIIHEVGLFDESFDAAEDYEFNYRIALNNKQSYISPKLTVYYYPRDDLLSLFKQMQRYGLGRGKMFNKYNEGLRSGAIAPPMFFFTLLAMTILSLFIEQLWILPLMMGGVYLSSILVAAGFVAHKKGLKYFPLLPPIYFTIHLGMAYGVIRGLFSRGSPRTAKAGEHL
ncbi:MAG TPA: glycosyltransferase family 2 protein [candidate division Zixibacteria bacterium]|nr:glycosyltransferase family 2 protein [candidate division Zixibacteria bacterium]